MHPVNFDLSEGPPFGQSPLLQVTNLCRDFGGVRALAMVSFNITPGEIVGVIGPNGAGKTTLFALLSGFLTPSHGEIRFMEAPIAGMRPDRVCHLGMARTFQVVRPFLELTVFEKRQSRGCVRKAGRALNRDHREWARSSKAPDFLIVLITLPIHQLARAQAAGSSPNPGYPSKTPSPGRSSCRTEPQRN